MHLDAQVLFVGTSLVELSLGPPVQRALPLVAVVGAEVWRMSNDVEVSESHAEAKEVVVEEKANLVSGVAREESEEPVDWHEGNRSRLQFCRACQPRSRSATGVDGCSEKSQHCQIQGNLRWA